MTKIYVLLEISSSNQLRKTNHEALDLVLERMDDICAEYQGCLTRHNRDLFFYMFPETMKSTPSFLDELMDFFVTTRERDDDLQGVSLFVDRLGEEDDEEAYELCRTRVYCSGGGASFLIGPGLEDEAKACSFELDTSTPFIRGRVTSGGGYLAEAEAQPLLSRENMIDRILEVLVPEIGSEKDYRLVHMYGPAGAGKRYNLLKALERLAKDTPTCTVAVVAPVNSETAPETPFLRGLDPVFLRRVPEFLSPLEQKIWSEHIKIITHRRGDRMVTEFILMYQLYLTAYARHMDGLGLPPVFICTSLEDLSAGSVSLLARFCVEFLARSALVPIILSEGRSLDQRLEHLPRLAFKVSPMPWKEVEAKLRKLRDAGIEPPEKMEDYYEGDARLLHMNLGIYRSGGTPQKEAGRDETASKAATMLSANALKVLLAEMVGVGMADAEVSELLHEAGVTPGQEERGRSECMAAGLLDNERTFPFHPEELLDVQVHLIEDKEPGFPLKFAETLAGGIRRHHYRPDVEMIRFICRYAEVRKAVEAGVYAVDRLTDAGCLDEADKLVTELYNALRRRVRRSDSLMFDLSLASLRVRMGVLREDPDMCRDSLLDVDEIDELEEKHAAAGYRLEYARYLYIFREFRKALAAAKRALFLAEDCGDDSLTGMANVEIGVSMMSLGKTGEAAEYFSLASELLRGGTRPVHRGNALVLEAAAEFLMGGLDSSLSLLSAAGEIFSTAGLRNLELFTLFFTGRVLFRLGMYQEAAVRFGRALSVIELYGLQEARKTVSAWLARCDIYLFKTKNAERLLESLERDHETGLFLAEARYMAGDADGGRAILEEILSKSDGDEVRLTPGDGVDWKTGFSSLEDRTLSSPERGSVLSHVVRGFRSYLLGRTGRGDEAYVELMQLTRDDKLGESDPNNMLYFYFASEVLTDNIEDEEINRLTLLSKALKYLQATASRIADPKLKQAYLWRNYWNARLMREGREKKLV